MYLGEGTRWQTKVFWWPNRKGSRMKRCFAAIAIFIGTFTMLTLGMVYEAHRQTLALSRGSFIVSVLITVWLAVFAVWLSGRLIRKSAP
jgi:hypothetical protein